MDLQTVVGVLVVLLCIAGLVGSFVPWLPGPLFILIGAGLWALVTDFAEIGIGRLAILAALAALTVLLNFVAGALGTGRAGGTRWGVVGAVAGAIVGVFFGVPGLLLGPIAGAVAGELLAGGDLYRSLRSGVGAAVGLIAGTVADVAVALTMIGLLAWWVWRG